jgi:hypothetical protein
MKLEWKDFVGKMLNITLNENYGLAMDTISDTPLYEIVFKTGRLVSYYDEGLLLEAEREKQQVKIFVPYHSIKCVEIFNL